MPTDKTDTKKDAPTTTAAPLPGRAVFAPPAKPEGDGDKPAEDTKKTRGKTTLGQLGPRLPVGSIVHAGGTTTVGGIVATSGEPLVKRIDARPWRTLEEKAIAKFKKKGDNMAQHVTLVVACMCSEFGALTWPDMPAKQSDVTERRVQLAQMSMGDVLYAYCYLRREAMGNIIKMNVQCPFCQHKWLFPADLDTLEVITVEHPDALYWTYTLQRPVDIRGKKVTGFRMGPTPWHSVEMAATGVITDATSKLAVLRGAIVGFVDNPQNTAMTEADMDYIHKRDLEGLVSAVDDMNVGPKMALELTCERCEKESLQPIDWRYDAFFSNSSR